MNFLIRRTSKKEYDGPVTSSSVSGVAVDTYDSFNISRRKRTGGGDRRVDSHSSISSRSILSSSSSRATSSSKQYHSSRGTSKITSSSSSRPRRSSEKESRQKQLASGISSRRTSQQVKNHLPAHVMSGRSTTSSNKGRDGSRKSGRHGKRGSSRGSASRDSAYYSRSSQHSQSQKSQSIQIPMEHDGGILCVEPVPDANKSNSNSKYRQGFDDGVAHRFLSGGTDGTVKLWEVFEPPLDTPDEAAANNVQLVPRLVKTYRGHRGYVHSIAILGTFDPLDRRGSHQLHHDNESCSSEEDDMSFSSTLSSSHEPRRHDHEKKRFLARRSSNGSQESHRQMLKKLGRQKRDLFVTASRDNTLRIWELENPNEHEEYFEDSSEEEEYARSKKKDPLRKGKKLRGHGFAVNGGVLCACAVPSTSTSMLDVDEEDNGMASAGQFVSGGCDGVIRVWDVKTALSLEKAPKSGRYHTIQLQQLNPFASNESGGSDEDENPVAASIRSGSSRSAAAAVTSLKCFHSKDSSSIALFASYSDGSIRKYSPVTGTSRNGFVKNAIRWRLTCAFGGHHDAVTSLSLLTSPSLLQLLSPDDEEQCSSDQTGTILISSCAQGVIRVWDALESRQGIERLECESFEKSETSVQPSVPTREALWEIELNDDDEAPEDDCKSGGDRPPTSINVRTLTEPVGIISLTALNEGRVMVAGTTDGQIRLWDVSSGLYEGTYNLGKQVQVWSLTVLSEREYYRGYDEFGNLQIHNAGIIIAGDNRGRLRILRKLGMRKSTEAEAMDDEVDQIFGE